MSSSGSPSKDKAAAPASTTPDSYPDLASPTDSVIAGDFGSLSPEAQEQQRTEWKAQLSRTEEEISTLRQVLESKEAQAAALKRRLGITHWREFSEDMNQGLKMIQDSQAYKKTAEVANIAKERAEGLFSSLTNTASYISMSERVGSAFGAAKTKMSQSLSTQDVKAEAAAPESEPSKTSTSTEEKKK
ncbi:F13E61 [Caligus rogercresseyi]|uniref:F13E6.1 n=1 Tax=Caligus rogercresseyi TaxID=217165 RepID=C1BQ62_CALRO|nr:F13E6.1 [Caligus rogercresseyi]QQP53226.1 F13E61 [Caligus rogercresseyi]|eukprot:TRINITY_DN1198_c0_g1_i1.p1 TRINITY_DN1198_c0_g1~~TRINITY_DN1198_c0_g1_i1.p1  ORF type:complete len:188 (-),score=77.27 TRINITY_DN1198_c0_g1_i1:919-1482(-)